MAERTAERSRLLDVLDADAVVGGVWMVAEGDEPVVYDVVLDRPDAAADVVQLLVDRARAQSARMIGIGVQPGDDPSAAVAGVPRLPGARHEHGARPDGETSADSGDLALRPMTADEFVRFTDGEVEGFAAELAAAGMEREQAPRAEPDT